MYFKRFKRYLRFFIFDPHLVALIDIVNHKAGQRGQIQIEVGCYRGAHIIYRQQQITAVGMFAQAGVLYRCRWLYVSLIQRLFSDILRSMA